MTNAEFAQKDPEFCRICSQHEIAATKRQASKFRNKHGKAYRALQVEIEAKRQAAQLQK